MIDKGDFEALVVAAPDDLHCPMTMAALDAIIEDRPGPPSFCNGSKAQNARHGASTIV